MLWKDPPALQCQQALGRGLEGPGRLGCINQWHTLLFQTPQKSCEAELRVSSSQSLLEEEDPAPLSQQLQATCASGREPLHHLDLPPALLVAVEYLPFYRTHGQLLAEDESALQPRVCRPQAADPSIGEVPLPEDSELNGGFFPHYRSKEEHFPSLALPGRSCGGSQDPPTRSEAQAGCFCRTTVSCGCSVSGGGHGGVREQHWAPGTL